MKTSRPIAAAASLLPVIIVIGALFGCTDEGCAQAFQPGEILVSSVNGALRYSANGTLLQSYVPTGIGAPAFGVALTPDGNLVATYYNSESNDPVFGIDVFKPDGQKITSFDTIISTFPNDVSVFSNGTYGR